MKGTRVLLLDLDRTLVDLQSYTDYRAALADARAIAGDRTLIRMPATDWDSPTVGCMATLNTLVGDAQWEEVSSAISGYERAAIPQARVMPTVVQVLPLLRQHPVAVVTLLPKEVSLDVLTACGIDVGPGCAIDLVIGRQRHIRPKPAPDGLLAACVRLGVDPAQATMIGDSTWDREAAVAAGIEFIGVPFTAGSLGTEVRQAVHFAEAVALACR